MPSTYTTILSLLPALSMDWPLWYVTVQAVQIQDTDVCITKCPISTLTVGSWWSWWGVIAAHQCYASWGWWFDSLWVTLVRLWPHLFHVLHWVFSTNLISMNFLWKQDLEDADMEILVLLEGVDASTSSKLQGMSSVDGINIQFPFCK